MRESMTEDVRPPARSLLPPHSLTFPPVQLIDRLVSDIVRPNPLSCHQRMFADHLDFQIELTESLVKTGSPAHALASLGSHNSNNKSEHAPHVQEDDHASKSNGTYAKQC